LIVSCLLVVFLLETDSTWGKEIFEFPIRFAQEIKYKGYEEARFPKGWSNPDTITFWSYAFAWKIEKERGVYIPNTVALFIDKDKSQMVGKIRTFDNFRNKRLFTLNVLVEKKYCERTNASLVLFKFSPKEFGHEVWEILDEVKFREGICNQ